MDLTRGRIGALFAGVPVDDVTFEEAVDRILELVGDGRAKRRTHQVATVNVDFVVNAQSDPTLRRILRRTSLSIPDGMPIVWGARLLRTPIRERVAGADLVPALGSLAARHGLRLALFGAGPGVAERAAQQLRAAHPGLDVVADPGPSFTSLDDLSIGDLDWLVRERPDICCVAFGNPKQELFIDRFADALGIPVMIGVGGTLDFLVGVQRRAPRWMQRSGLEWVHRLASDPRRLAGRYLHDARVFVPAILRQARTGRVRSGHGELCVRSRGGELVIDVAGVRRFDNRTAAELTASIRHGMRTGRPIALDGVDSNALGSVTGLIDWFEDIDRDGGGCGS